MSRLAFVFLEIFSCEGGIQSYGRDLFHALSTEQIQADVFLLRDAPDCLNPFAGSSLRFYYCQRAYPPLGRLQLIADLLRYLLRSRPERVFCGHMKLAPLVWNLCQPLGIPYTILTHGKEVWHPLPYLQHRALQAANRIWTVSRYSRDRLCATHHIPAHRVDFLGCVVDPERFQPTEKLPELVEQYQLADAQVLLTVARLWSGDPYKGVDVTIRALPDIARVVPNVKYLVVGRGDDQPRLARLAQDCGVADRVVFAGFVPTEALPQHYNLADAYVMPSQEGFGMVYLEAMACGKPVLAGDADGSADPLQDGRLGWRVPHRNVAAVARACIEMLQGDDPRCNGAWLRQQVIAACSQPAFAQQLLRLILPRDRSDPLANGEHPEHPQEMGGSSPTW